MHSSGTYKYYFQVFQLQFLNNSLAFCLAHSLLATVFTSHLDRVYFLLTHDLTVKKFREALNPPIEEHFSLVAMISLHAICSVIVMGIFKHYAYFKYEAQLYILDLVMSVNLFTHRRCQLHTSLK